MPQSIDSLCQRLIRLDGRNYKAYRDIAGTYAGGVFELTIDYVQGDPFAPPSRARIRVPFEKTGIPADLAGNAVRRMALEDYLARRFRRCIHDRSGDSGVRPADARIYIDAGGQEVLSRTAVRVTSGWIEARFQVGLPAAGRRILGRSASHLLGTLTPEIAGEALTGFETDTESLARFVRCIENQETIRSRLEAMNLIGFVADGAILPRAGGNSDRPMPEEAAVPFESPERFRVAISLPNPVDPKDPDSRTLTGMGIPEGVILITGGGYHGKSTLLRALERGVYPHVPGDGREYVVTRPDAVKIRAEDRRSVVCIDLSSFISELPGGQKTVGFTTPEASGSTSQAAAIIEAFESGSRTLLIDEDTCATNLMVRDARMQSLVTRSHEPITPLVDRVRELYDSHRISTVLVMGGSGDYFDCADHVIMLRDYRTTDVTSEARKIAASLPTRRDREAPRPFAQPPARIPDPHSIDPSHRNRRHKIDAKSIDSLRFGSETIDLRAVEQLVDTSQTRAIGFALYRLANRLAETRRPIPELLDDIEADLDEHGPDILDPFAAPDPDNRPHPGNLAHPRRHEIAAALNRLRTLRITGLPPGFSG